MGVAVLCGILGALLASFAGVLSERLNTNEGWIRARSRCNSCARHLGMRDLVPVLSWLSSGGRCRYCRTRIPARYPFSELLLGGVFFWAAYTLGPTLALVAFLVSCFALMLIVLYDLRHTVVPLFLAVLLIVSSTAYALLATREVHALGVTFLAAGLIGLGFFLMHALSGGRWMGLGDAPVALALSILVGGGQAIPGLLFSFWIGAAVGIVILVAAPKGHRMGIEVPFVPFLALGYLLAFFTQWNPFTLL